VLSNIDRVAAAAESIDLSKVPSKSAELSILFNQAEESLLRLLAFARKADISMVDGRTLEAALYFLAADENGKRVVQILLSGRPINIPLDMLDDNEASMRAMAEQFGVTTQDVMRYEMSLQSDGGTSGIPIECNHRAGCRRTKLLYFGDPAQMVSVERQASMEVWYCAEHREAAFKSHGALSDEVYPILFRIKETPGLTQKETGAKRDYLAFLEVVGLIKVERMGHSGRVLVYQISLTEAGHGALAKAKRIG